MALSILLRYILYVWKLLEKEKKKTYLYRLTTGTSVVDPNPYVFGPPGSGSFYHQAKIVNLEIFTVL